MPVEVPEAKPPMPSASSHSSVEAGVFMESSRKVLWRSLILAASFKAGIERHSAVHENARAVDIIGVVARQPHNGAANIVRFADTFVGNQLHQFAIGLRCAPGLHVDRRADRAGTDRVHANALRRDFLRDAFHHEHYSAFAGGIVDVTGPRDDLVDTAHANDFPRGTT